MSDLDSTPSPALSGRSEPDNLKPGSFATSSTRTSTATGTSRLEKVSAKDICDFEDTRQLVSVMHDAILVRHDTPLAHQRLYTDGGVLHGDISPNTIVMLQTADGKVEGALIDYDVPLCQAAMRKLWKPDPVVAPQQRARPRERYIPGTHYKLGPGS